MGDEPLQDQDDSAERVVDAIVLTRSIVTVIGPTPPGNRCHMRGLFANTFEVDIADQLPGRQAIDFFDIDNHRTGSHHLGQDKIWVTGHDHQHIREKRKLREVTGFAWQIATVASRCMSISAIGFPTLLPAPTTTTFFPSRPIPADSGDVARSFRDHVARCSGMKSPG